MSILHNCESCRHGWNVPEKAVGKRVRCPKCTTVQLVPEPLPEVPQELISCIHCQENLHVPGDIIGKKVRCPSCRGVFLAKIMVATPVAPLSEQNSDFLDGIFAGFHEDDELSFAALNFSIHKRLSRLRCGGGYIHAIFCL